MKGELGSASSRYASDTMSKKSAGIGRRDDAPTRVDSFLVPELHLPHQLTTFLKCSQQLVLTLTEDDFIFMVSWICHLCNRSSTFLLPKGPQIVRFSTKCDYSSTISVRHELSRTPSPRIISGISFASFPSVCMHLLSHRCSVKCGPKCLAMPSFLGQSVKPGCVEG
jgi:hypothetical protein